SPERFFFSSSGAYCLTFRPQHRTQRQSKAPIAQLDRAQAYEAWGRTPESYWARHHLGRRGSRHTPSGVPIAVRRRGSTAASDVERAVQQERDWMRLALAEADAAASHGDVPIGALLIDGDGRVLARGHNRREERGDPTAHAEIEALRAA